MAKKALLPIQGVTSDGAQVAINEIDLGCLTQLAGWGNFSTAAAQALAVCSLALPDDYRSPTRSETATVWRIAPDRVLVKSRASPGFESTDDLVVLDLSQARVSLTLDGPGAAGLLSRVIALDFGEAAFPIGTFAQTALHHVGVLVERHERDQFTVLMPTTWAISLTSLLADHLAQAA